MSKIDEAIELLTEQPGVGGPEHAAYYDLAALIENRVLPLLREIKEETS